MGWYHFPKALYGFGRDLCLAEGFSRTPEEGLRVVQAVKKNARKTPSTKYPDNIIFFFFFNLNTADKFVEN
jgi:hypothetical protein